MERWTYEDAKYKEKKISSWKVCLNYGTKRGGEIYLESKDYSTTIYFMYWENALGAYNQIKTVKDIQYIIKKND